ncbi:hypothetical protein [Sporomusa sp.]|uniref:VgrG-related protein n=1 Tax=Sporomusa sp. TaxID=2078658 RepID=UPI002CD58C15|nr:hypothetical protein [Sporomusa sp.]HWR09891.1 hypothetical protein [Sporomusa sp.]
MRIGELSAKYESNGNPGTVSTGWGDAGGISYGCYQLATNTGSVDSFVCWLKEQGHPYGDMLSTHPAGSPMFSATWKYCAENDAGGFVQLQHDYIQYAYYDPAVAALRAAYFNIENHHAIMQDIVWSRTVQYGTGNIVELFELGVKSIGYENLSYVDAPNFDAELIRAIYSFLIEEADNVVDNGNDWYKSPQRWINGSWDVVCGLRNRFVNECADALAILTQNSAAG